MLHEEPRTSWKTLLRPSIFNHKGSKKLRPTAYLDGLRGMAAFLVYVTHHIGASHYFGAPINVGWGREGYYSLITFPFLRILFSGSHFAVSIFFVISGFVLSRGPIKMMRNGKQVGSSLSSAVFRRGIRLWLPVVVTTFMYMTIRHLGIYASYPVLRDNYFVELAAYFDELWRFTYMLRIEENPYLDLAKSTFSYNPHTWTIALEYQGSIMLFIVLMAFSTLTSKARMTFIAGLAVYFNLHGSWVSFCFLSGCLLAELDLMEVDALRNPSANVKLGLYVMLISGLYLGGMPTVELRSETREYLASNPGWTLLSSLIPSAYDDIKPFWLSWGAVLVITSGTYLPIFRSFFELPFLQYLGRISFAFYLVHGPVLQVIGMRMYHITGQTFAESGWLAAYNNWLPLPKAGPFGLEVPFLAANMVTLPITFYLAEVVERLVDEPSVRAARWCYMRVSAK